MGLIEIMLTGVGLSADAFAASICKGLSMRRLSVKHMLLIAVFFGGFQAMMPLIGYVLGKQFEQDIVSVDHWIAFALLGFIGGKMIVEAIRGDEEVAGSCAAETRLDLREILTLAVATSIDALAVGISFAFLQVQIGPAVGLIGAITFVLSCAGVAIGHRFGAKYKNKATLAGGVILILIGLKILSEHLGIL